MTVSLIQILTGYGQSVVNDIRGNLSSSGSNATGKTSTSVQYSVSEDGTKTTLFVYGRPFIFTVETGRGPRKSTRSYNLASNILEWLETTGKVSGLSQIQKESKAKSLTWFINKFGTKLYRQGGRKDIISNVVTPTLFDKITDDVMDQLAKAYMDEVQTSVA